MSTNKQKKNQICQDVEPVGAVCVSPGTLVRPTRICPAIEVIKKAEILEEGYVQVLCLFFMALLKVPYLNVCFDTVAWALLNNIPSRLQSAIVTSKSKTLLKFPVSQTQ